MAGRVAARVVGALAMFAAFVVSATPTQARQLGTLAAPGPLTKAHAAVATDCAQCHEAARKVTARKCLVCHKPIEERIARKTGVHRAVTVDCAPCHSEHAGANAELRRIDLKRFDHQAETGYPLDGGHAAIAQKCAACHTTRSFLKASVACGSCHQDTHKGTLGVACASCHSTTVPFKQTRTHFDHSRARFTLTGAHLDVTCEKCHAGGKFRGLVFNACTSCHQEPHKGKFNPTCTTCHTTAKWATTTVEHGRTRFGLKGAHQQVACAKCHPSGATKPVAFATCSACHASVHKDSIKDDCRVCHTETSFRNAPFDHAARTTFALTGKHASVECRKCHTSVAVTAAASVPLAQKVADFKGAKTECISCHVDKHAGQYGRLCDACHRMSGFSVEGFTHPRTPEFFAGPHAGVTCVRCHGGERRRQPTATPSLAAVQQVRTPSTACASCHADSHLGQLGLACERCHTIAGSTFSPERFRHEAAAFTLTGKHQAVPCARCHQKAVKVYPSGSGVAVQFHPVDQSCGSCHVDQHLGQVGAKCETCHSTGGFGIATYTHQKFEQFFAGNHGKLTCVACHKKETGEFPSGTGTTVRYRVGTSCASCHKHV